MIYNVSLYVFIGKMISYDLRKNWFDLHLGEFQRVTVRPDHSLIVGRVNVIGTVQV